MIRQIIGVCLMVGINQGAHAASSKEMVETEVEYIYVAPSNITEDEAKYNALQRAKLQALEEHYGTVVSQNNTTNIRTEGEMSETSFLSLSSSEVSGEWVETIGKPEYEVWYDGSLIIKVKVKGKIRPIERNTTDIDIKVLCNGTTEKFERTSFRDGDDLYLSLISPVDGFVAIYLTDFKNVYCLLPYPNDPGQASPVRAGKKRILFSYNHNDANEAVKQYHMTCNSGFETNIVYVCFSTHAFDKALDNSDNHLLPRMLSYEDFCRWLAKNKRMDKDFQVKECSISITQ